MLTRGIRLNDLVGKRFTVGEVECVGQELCEPCNHLQGLTQPGVLRGLVHRGGLRADIVSGGTDRRRRRGRASGLGHAPPGYPREQWLI